jgi:hypothetical protein
VTDQDAAKKYVREEAEVMDTYSAHEASFIAGIEYARSLPQPHPPSESDVAAAEKWCKSEYNLEPKDSPRIYAKLIQPSFLAGCEFKAAEKDKVIGELRNLHQAWMNGARADVIWEKMDAVLNKPAKEG